MIKMLLDQGLPRTAASLLRERCMFKVAKAECGGKSRG